MAGGGGNKKRYQYCSDSSGIILYLRALQGHSGCCLIDPTLQDNVIIPDGFFKYISHVGCAINLHSIINSGLIPGGQHLNNRQTVFFLLVDPMDTTHKDPDTIDLEAPRLAQYMHKACMEETSKYGVLGRHQTCSKQKIKVLSDAIERYHSSRNTPSFLYSERCCDGIWRSQIRDSMHVTSASTKDLLETRLEKRIGFRSCSTTRGRSCSTTQKFPIKPTKSKPRSQCKECLSYWSEGIVYCTCGQLLKESAANRGVTEYTLDLLSIPNYVIKKGRPHGHRYGKTTENREHHQAHNLKKRCTKKHPKEIHDRFFERS